ncbi:uncharacterized protein LOC127800733 [Diospyros lotus]|uniref:uncharacterized protein LOC127800733 n=1 Tax=Diospyros lotus TaxID=55363 RepID=UPI002253476E|nr:uncharacterized protein LOC127800733 [Diospyros lotus]
MALRKYVPSCDGRSVNMKPLSFPNMGNEKAQLANPEKNTSETDVDIDLGEVYFLIMHFLSAGPCHRTYGQLWNELLEHQLLPRRYHAWYSRSGVRSGDENDDGLSFPLSYNQLAERYPHVEKGHLVNLLKRLILNSASPSRGVVGGGTYSAAAVPTLLGTGSFSLLGHDQGKINNGRTALAHLRWPHMRADQVRGLHLREIGGGFTRHHRAPSVRAACYAIAKPSTMVQKMQNIKKLRGHVNAVYCAIFDQSGRYVITGSDDRLVKIWSMETAYCLASCRGHEGDITDLAVSSNNTLVASASNDCIIRIWRLPDGLPISVLRGHTGAVTAIAFSPRPGSVYQLLSSSDDGTCRIWDARYSQFSPRIYVPRPLDSVAGKNNGASSSTSQQSHQIFCCAFNANGTVFVTGSSDTLARVWSACKSNADESEPNHEIDVLAGHENDVNYVQFSGCTVASRFSIPDTPKEDNIPKFKNTWFNHDNIVTCSRDGSAIIWIPRSRRSHGKVGRWTRAYHLKVPPPPMPPQPPRGGPRQRILPTPRGVNMIVWSLDNRFVLAAIMDCRICVWNAVDGSLVHSLTGHSDSTYVLDVHPFNPRIAMSAGYDGKTIVWDIWEGTPICTYEVGRFKLVDGKFSPDGTSIILSDHVGQLYILSTGQGESQKDAKYDQFFLGDYRPIIQDIHGNVLDQESQLVPYRRNMQDLLCDASMIPYPEPYQSMYQKRRLGALGIEWRPSSVRFAVGPDINLDQGRQILPLADLDLLIDPLPEFVEPMDWELENDVQTEDTDSEYNVTEEYSSGGEQGSFISSSSGDLEYSAEDSEVEGTNKDALRRSKRKKPKIEVEIMTSSGRRVKRKILDECLDESQKHHQRRKSRHGRKASRKKALSSKSMRPQRAAARNALTLFSRITGMSKEGEGEDGSEGDLSESESTLQDIDISSDEFDKTWENKRQDHSKGKEVLVESEDLDKTVDHSESCIDAGNRRRLVLKLPIRDLNKSVATGKAQLEDDKKPGLLASSSKSPREANDINENYSQDPDYSSGEMNHRRIERNERGKKSEVNCHSRLFEGYNQKIKWGGFRARTAKRVKMGELSACAGSGSNAKINSVGNGQLLLEKECGKVCTSTECQFFGSQTDEMVPINQQLVENANSGDLHSSLNEHQDYDGLSRQDHKVVDTISSPVPYTNAVICAPELQENPLSSSTLLRIMSEKISKEVESPEAKIRSDGRKGGINALPESPDAKHNLNSEVPDDDGNVGPSSDHGDQKGLEKSEAQIVGTSNSVLQESWKSNSHDKMYNVVYRRSKLSKDRSNPEGDSGCVETTKVSSVSNHNLDVGVESPQATSNGVRRTRSMGLRAASDDVNAASCNIILREDRDESKDALAGIQKSSTSACNELPCEQWRSGRSVSGVGVGLRSTRNRRSSYRFHDYSLPDRRKSHHPAKNSWLMLSTHEEGSRYIPQLGDEVVYLRQGHEEYYSSHSSAKDERPWRKIRGNIRAVEFCMVAALEYTAHSGSGDGCCKMSLKFVDSSSSVAGKSFTLTLPELTSFPDFLVERSRYDAAMQRNWTFRDKCQVWWKNEGEENGSWWEGRIIQVKPKSLEFPDSPWEKYVVLYKSDPAEILHSPWELHDAEIQWEPPRISDEIREKLLCSFDELDETGAEDEDPCGIRSLKQVSQKSSFLNRFPVPMSLDVIQSRLENNYYRSLESMRHDVSVMLSNAEAYFGRNGELTSKMRRLGDWFGRMFSSL